MNQLSLVPCETNGLTTNNMGRPTTKKVNTIWVGQQYGRSELVQCCAHIGILLVLSCSICHSVFIDIFRTLLYVYIYVHVLNFVESDEFALVRVARIFFFSTAVYFYIMEMEILKGIIYVSNV